DGRVVAFDRRRYVGQQGRLNEGDVARAQEDRPLVAARAQGVGARDERLERAFAGIVDRRKAGACLDADGKDWVRYLRERARHAHGEPDAAEVDRRFVAAHAARCATGEEEACRVTWLDQITTSLADRT